MDEELMRFALALALTHPNNTRFWDKRIVDPAKLSETEMEVIANIRIDQWKTNVGSICRVLEESKSNFDRDLFLGTLVELVKHNSTGDEDNE